MDSRRSVILNLLVEESAHQAGFGIPRAKQGYGSAIVAPGVAASVVEGHCEFEFHVISIKVLMSFWT
jgi:hypothetical protein